MTIEDLDNPLLTEKRAEIIKEKKFLYRLYQDWYSFLGRRLKSLPEGPIIELGSGGGFIKDLYPDVVTSDVLTLSTVDMVFSAEKMPFDDNTLSCIFMIDVLHHIPNCENFFAEAQRCLKKDGMIIMSEPANTPWSSFFYKNFHHEPFDAKSGWSIPASSGPLSGANGAIPYIVFTRDRMLFEKKFPLLKIIRKEFHTPFRYLISGGLSYRSLLPGNAYPFVKSIERLFSPLFSMIAMFELIELKKTDNRPLK